MNIFKIFVDYRQFQIFILSIFSGMPLFIIYTTLATWMSVKGVDIAVVTIFASARVFYSLKFIWAPFIDQINLPMIYKIGHRKSWMCFVSSVIALIIFSYSQCDPNQSLSGIYILTIALGFSSATLDIVIDAFRIDTIEQKKQSIAAANGVLGYRIGGMIAVAGMFYIAEDYRWSYAFMVISALYVVGIIFMLTLTEPKRTREIFQDFTLHSWQEMVVNPFLDFLKRKGAIIILLAVIFYKLGDAMLGVVSAPFYIKMGFSPKEIGTIVKIFGVWVTIAGTYIGGFIMYRFGHFKGLIIGGIAQSITNLSFVWLHHMGHDTNALVIAIVIENIASGMGDAALIGYLSYLCNKQFSATQYALFSSASGLFSHTLVMYGGSLVKMMGWDMYFIMTILLAIPGLILLLYLNNKYGFSNNPSVD